MNTNDTLLNIKPIVANTNHLTSSSPLLEKRRRGVMLQSSINTRYTQSPFSFLQGEGLGMRCLSANTPYIYSVCLFSKGGNKGIMSVAKGINVMAKGMAGVAKGINMMAKGINVMAKGINVMAKGMAGVVKGINVMAKGMAGVAKGINMMAKGMAGVAMGMAGVAKGSNVMAMGKAGMAKYSRFRDEKLNSKIIVVNFYIKNAMLMVIPQMNFVDVKSIVKRLTAIVQN